MRKPKDWGQPCPNPGCAHYRLMSRGNISALSTYLTQSGKQRHFPVQRLPYDLFRDAGHCHHCPLTPL